MTDQEVVYTPVQLALSKESNDCVIEGVHYQQALYAAISINLHPNYLAKLCKEGDCEFLRDSRNRIWISQAALDAFVASRADAVATRKANKGKNKGAKGKYPQLPMNVRFPKKAIAMLREGVKNGFVEEEDVEVAVNYLQDVLDGALAAHIAKREAAPKTVATKDPEFEASLK